MELDIDEGLLLASDYNAFDKDALRTNVDNYLKDITRNNVQLLINKIWELPIERVDEAIVAKLPKPKYILPRARCIPKTKPLTKWEQFAKEKGIKKKKNQPKKKWDEILQKWVSTYGYQRTKSEKQRDWLVEINDNNDAKTDHFTVKSNEKRERQSKNELQRLRNLAKSKNIKVPRVGLPTAEHFPDSRQLGTAAAVAKVSTASIGKFTDRPLNEPKRGRMKSSKKKSIGAKKPKAGKGKRNLHEKVGGRKRR